MREKTYVLSFSLHNSLSSSELMHNTFLFLLDTACVLPHIGGIVIGNDDLIVTGVATIGKCIRLCIQETRLVCRSAEFMTSGPIKGRCQLSRKNTASASYKSFNSVNLYEICEYL